MQRLVANALKSQSIRSPGYCRSNSRKPGRGSLPAVAPDMRRHATAAGSKLQQLYEQALVAFGPKQQPQARSDLEALTSVLTKSSEVA